MLVYHIHTHIGAPPPPLQTERTDAVVVVISMAFVSVVLNEYYLQLLVPAECLVLNPLLP